MTYKDADGWNTEASLSKLRDGAVCVVGREGRGKRVSERRTGAQSQLPSSLQGQGESGLGSSTLDDQRQEDRFKLNHKLFMFNMMPSVLDTRSRGFSVVSSCRP